MPDVRSQTVHQREVSCFLTGSEVKAIIEAHALKLAGYEPGTKGLKVTVKLDDETTGSPSYKVGTKARVDIVEALAASPAEVGGGS